MTVLCVKFLNSEQLKKNENTGSQMGHTKKNI